MLKRESVVKLYITLITFIMTFFLGRLLQAQQSSQQEKIGFKEGLSYTQDYTWFAKKNNQNGISEVTQSRQSQPWRMATWEERIQYFISRLKQGDRKAFLYVNYGLLDGYGNPYTHRSVRGYPTNKNNTISQGILWHLVAKAKKLNVSIEQVLTDGNSEIRKNVVKSVLAGLFNKDPRVRLVTINLLRRLRPDSSMTKDIKRAMLLETMTSERSKWREKDIDIPSIEEPRLGWASVSWNGVSMSNVDTSIRELWHDGSANGEKDLLDGNGKGLYLSEGIYRQGQLNYYPGTITKKNHANPSDPLISVQVWMKSPLLRYGADNHVSGFEIRYGLSQKESLPMQTYLYSDPIHPRTQQFGENLYYAYHSVWEEMKKLQLFIDRVNWVQKIKSGSIKALKTISKDSFRALADQIDGESIDNVPMKSRNFKIFGEPEVRAIIVGMLENRVVSTREECIRFLLRLFEHPDVSIPVKKEIKKALREARRRELIIDTIRGRHVHALLSVAQQPDDWWGEEDEVNSSVWKKQMGSMLQKHRNQMEFPEESSIIYHDRRKPGQEEDGVTEENSSEQPVQDSSSKVKGLSEDSVDNADKFEDESFYGHPLLRKAFESEKLTLEDIEKYLQLSTFLNNSNTSKGSGRFGNDKKQRNILPGQYPGLVKKTNPASSLKRSYVASLYETVRAIETLHSLLLANTNDLLKATYLDLQNALLILQWCILKDAKDRKNNPKDLLSINFLQYFIAASNVVNSQGRRFHGHENLVAELQRVGRARVNLKKLLPALKAKIQNSSNHIKIHSIGLDLSTLEKMRGQYSNAQIKFTNAKEEPQMPGRSYVDSELGVSHRGQAMQSHGKFYGHGRGGYYNFYDQQIDLPEARNDYDKHQLGFYQIPSSWKQQRRKIVQSLLAMLLDKDPQKRLIVVHLLRRLIPDASMLPRINKLLREIETIDKRPYKFFDTVLNRDLRVCKDGEHVNNESPNSHFNVQEKIVGHELLKLQRFIVRRILINKIRNGQEVNFLKEIPKGSFLTLVLRIDAEWDPYRIPFKSFIPRNQTGSNGMFLTAQDIRVIRGGLENPNFIVQRETARWIISFLNHNYGTRYVNASDVKKFIQAINFAERRDIVYYERNYVNWKYSKDFSRTEYISGNPKMQAINVTGVPLGRVAVRVGSAADMAIFRKIDMDRKIEFQNDYGRVQQKGDFKRFDEPNVSLQELAGEGGSVRSAYRRRREDRARRKRVLGDLKRRNETLNANNVQKERYAEQGLDFKVQ